jgi:glycosyltransferase involved in cell wall biosynthesis
MSELPRSERIVVVTSSYPAHPDDPSGHFVAADVARRCRAGHDVVVLTPATTSSRFGIFGPKPPCGLTTGPSGERIARLPAGDAFGWPGALERLRERPTRALGALSFVRAARSFLRSSGPWNRLVAHFVLPSVWPITDGLERSAHAFEAVAHGSDVRLLKRLPGALRERIARTLAPFDLVCTSEELRNELESALGAAIARRARVAAPPIDGVRARGRADSRRELGVESSVRLLVIAGRLVRGKRADVALRAARLVPGALTVVVGDGPERAALERDFPEAAFVGLVGRARALTWLAAADAVLVASREEGAPSVVREARALGTPVVALPSGDLRAWGATDPGLFVVSPSS